MKITLPSDFTSITIDQWIKWNNGVNEVEAVQMFWDGDMSKVTVKALNASYTHLEKVFSEEDARFFKTFTHEGIRYGLINDWKNLTTGEWVDIETYMKDGVNTAHKVMSVLYRPMVRETTKSYEIEPYNGSHERFLDIPVSWYLGALVFFCERKNKLLKTSQFSLMEVAKRMLSRTDGGGTTLPTT